MGFQPPAFEFKRATHVDSDSNSHSGDIRAAPELLTTQEADAIFQRLGVMGVLAMVAVGGTMLGFWVVSDDPETLANACIYFVVNGLAMGVFGWLTVGYFYMSLVGLLVVGVVMFLTLRKHFQQ